MIVEFINGKYFDIDSTYPESEFYKDETVSVTSNNSTMFLLKHSTQLEYRDLPRRETNESPANDLFNDHCVIGINERMVND